MATVPLNEDVPSKRVGITADIQVANCELTSIVCLCPEMRPICFILDTDGNVFLLGCCLFNPSRIHFFYLGCTRIFRQWYNYFFLGCNSFRLGCCLFSPPTVQSFLPRVQLSFLPRVQQFPTRVQLFSSRRAAFLALLG